MGNGQQLKNREIDILGRDIVMIDNHIVVIVERDSIFSDVGWVW